ncbi:MAG: helix-turn-helix domain-containing protein [Dysgonomonas sp.]
MKDNTTTLNIKELEHSKESKDRSYSHNGNFQLHLGAKNIPIRRQLYHLEFGLLGLCTKGSASLDIYMQEYKIQQGGLIVILPNQLVSMKEKSRDFTMNYFIVSQSLINDVVSDVSRVSPIFFLQMRRKHYYELTEDEYFRFDTYYKLIHNRMKSESVAYEEDYITNTLTLFYLDLYNNFRSSLISTDSAHDTRKEKLVYDFFLLIMENYKENREVAFYADKLCITPKYLSTVIRNVSARSAKDWIVEYIILEIKYLLKSSNLNIQEIAVQTNFSNQTSLGRFFRKHTNMSPSEYRTLKRTENKSS